MRNLIPRHADYTDGGATEIDHGPHWSQLPRVAPRPEIAARPVPPRLPRAHQVNAADRSVAPTPPAGIAVPPPLPRAAAPVAFYSFAEEQAARAAHEPACPWALDTERVAPLPYGSIRPSWIDALDRMWSRFAAPALGMIAGLILVVGYLAYSTQAAPIASAASAARPVAPAVVMTAELEEPAVPAAELPIPRSEPTVAQVNAPAPAAKPARAKKAKRAPIRINDATPLGDLRPSR
ncbi:MAG: hypothetical protein JNL83_20900 [Myxococcales bacterium]|nr:hypothetical protein [Myxococcales bacterium]